MEQKREGGVSLQHSPEAWEVSTTEHRHRCTQTIPSQWLSSLSLTPPVMEGAAPLDRSEPRQHTRALLRTAKSGLCSAPDPELCKLFSSLISTSNGDCRLWGGDRSPTPAGMSSIAHKLRAIRNGHWAGQADLARTACLSRPASRSLEQGIGNLFLRQAAMIQLWSKAGGS